MAKKKTKNITPRFMDIPSAEQELVTQFVSGSRPFGESMGGLQMFSNSFRRGYGEKTFGVDERGLWLGASDFEDAPFKVDFLGRMFFSASNGDGQLVIDSENLRLVLYINEIPQALWGLHTDGF